VKPYTFETSDALMERAKKVVPAVSTDIRRHSSDKGAYPSFFARGDGSHIWDVDGNEYIDYMCSYGPIVLGHRHPKVEGSRAPPDGTWQLLQRARSGVGRSCGAFSSRSRRSPTGRCSRKRLPTYAPGRLKFARHATGRPKIAMCAALTTALTRGARRCPTE